MSPLSASKANLEVKVGKDPFVIDTRREIHYIPARFSSCFHRLGTVPK